jgi:molybdopterin molybdotransferase
LDVERQKFAPMVSLEEARELLLALVPRPQTELLSVPLALGRILARDVAAPIDLPIFDNSAMDGFALRAADINGASREKPIQLKLVAAVPAGARVDSEVAPGTCIRVFTGSPLPAGADAVLMQEDTETRDDLVRCLDSVKPWENVRLRGEDVRKGALVATRGERLNAGRTAILQATGLEKVEIARQPRVAVIATGNELLAPGEPLEPSHIYESNRAMLAALIFPVAGAPRMLPVVPDSLSATCELLQQAFAGSDFVICSGGVSVGEHDLVKKAFEQIGGTIDLWRIAIKPGKPFAFGRYKEKLLFGLPGNPVSAFVTFLMLVRPALLRAQGANEIDLPAHPAVLTEPLVNRGDRRHFIRVQVDANGTIRSAGPQASHMMNSLALANGLIDVPPETTLPTGAQVQALRWEL